MPRTCGIPDVQSPSWGKEKRQRTPGLCFRPPPTSHVLPRASWAPTALLPRPGGPDSSCNGLRGGKLGVTPRRVRRTCSPGETDGRRRVWGGQNRNTAPGLCRVRCEPSARENPPASSRIPSGDAETQPGWGHVPRSVSWGQAQPPGPTSCPLQSQEDGSPKPKGPCPGIPRPVRWVDPVVACSPKRTIAPQPGPALPCGVGKGVCCGRKAPRGRAPHLGQPGGRSQVEMWAFGGVAGDLHPPSSLIHH